MTSGGDVLEQARSLCGRLAGTPPAACWQLPFPIAVFGTLREGMGNNGLMHRGRIAVHRRAFLPHFYVRGIELYFRRGASAPFEIFGYGAEEWPQIIGPIDRLEDFRPDRLTRDGYHRTLAWLCLLADRYLHPAYEAEALDRERDLQIDASSWTGYERVPCWIYSSLAQNELAHDCPDSPIIWDGVLYR